MNTVAERFWKLNELQLDILYLVWFFNVFDKIINTVFSEKLTIQNKIDFDWEYIFLYNKISFYLLKNKELEELNKLFSELFWKLKSLSNLNNYRENYEWWDYDILNNEYWELVSEIRNLRYKYNVNLTYNEILEDNKNTKLLKQEDFPNMPKDFIDQVNFWISELKNFIVMQDNLEKKLKKYYNLVIKELELLGFWKKEQKVWVKSISFPWDEIVINNWIRISLSESESKAFWEIYKIKVIYKNKDEMKESSDEISLKTLQNITWSVSEKATEKIIKVIRWKIKEHNLNIQIPIKNKMVKFHIFKS